MSTEENKEKVRCLLEESLGGGKPELVDELLDSDFVRYDPYIAARTPTSWREWGSRQRTRWRAYYSSGLQNGCSKSAPAGNRGLCSLARFAGLSLARSAELEPATF